MKYFLYLLIVLSTIACGNSQENDQKENKESDLTTFYFLRHAEKQAGNDPELNEKGEKRAEQWVEYFFLKDVDHVMSSDFKRTKATAAPLAQSKKLDVETYDVRSLDGDQLLEKYRGKTVVLFGHSNTIGTYANQLQNDEKFDDLNESDYDHFYMVTIDSNGNARAVKEETDFMEF
ncbi:phosphoglycerate mutase [Nonlabens spongiae]|uniref:Phosphoglycerate mutase n=1 Tax=Nonlabens spongiae TaxID=331648 RepID=A0A1W6MHB6_9FLAO|nr:histidine phosphatase family protein [Nonlabens spongiae]ARN76988.1 phosphoglycerate mutase [Nonlabens spongiae]